MRMTIEEARGFLIGISYKLGNMSVEYLSEKDGEKMREAISVLEQEPTTNNDLGVDLISRADTIKAIQEKAKKLTNKDTINGLCGAVAILFDLPSVTPQEPKWIPVSEKLPKAEYGESDSVLVCFENGTQDVLYFDGSNWCYPTGEIYISVNHKNGWHNKVIAWMPLPKPYEPQESGDKE